MFKYSFVVENVACEIIGEGIVFADDLYHAYGKLFCKNEYENNFVIIRSSKSEARIKGHSRYLSKPHFFDKLKMVRP